METTYEHLSATEREHIAIMKEKGLKQSEMARKLGRSPSTISRELKRNAPPVHKGYYLGHKAHERAKARKQTAGKRDKLKCPELRAYVGDHLSLGWSPEIIAGRWNKDHHPTISPEAIYQYIYSEKPDWIAYLPRRHKKRHSKGHSRKHRRSHIPNRVSIEQRSAAANEREELGHWEADSIVSSRSLPALNIVVERVTRLTKISKLEQKTAGLSSQAIIDRLANYPSEFLRSITYDNGSENVAHEAVNESLGTTSYFCAPYHSWEKGGVENTAGLVRRFFPKKTDFNDVSHKEIERVENLLNNRPRKCLGFLTPYEVANNWSVAPPC